MATPIWRCTIDTTDADITAGPTPGVWIVDGHGQKPTIEDLTVTPPEGPPDTPPVVPPVVDDSPFDWPSPWFVTGQDSDRAFASWLIPGRREDDPHAKVYVLAQPLGNPSARSHHNAGIIQAGRWTGERLWAPHNAPPAMLRAIITTGQP